MDEDQAYRAMDLLIEADAQAQVQEAVFFAVADLLNLEVDLLFFDTTSTYFERNTEEVPSQQEPAGGLRRYGHSKDSRPDLPQIVIGLAVTREGIPVRCWVCRATPPTSRSLPEVKDDLRGWRLGRVVTVVDRRFSSKSKWITCAGPVGTGSPGSGCATATPGRRRRCPGKAATGRFGTTCGSRKSPCPVSQGCAGSSATTRPRPSVTPPGGRRR
jgi:hypothetical protein